MSSLPPSLRVVKLQGPIQSKIPEPEFSRPDKYKEQIKKKVDKMEVELVSEQEKYKPIAGEFEQTFAKVFFLPNAALRGC